MGFVLDRIVFNLDHRQGDLRAGKPPPPKKVKEILWGGEYPSKLSEARILENLFLVATGIRNSSMFHPIDEKEILRVNEAAEKIGIGMVVRKAGKRVHKVFLFNGKKEKMAERIPDVYEDMGFRDFIVAQIAIARMTGHFLDYSRCCVESFITHLMDATDQDLAAQEALKGEEDPDPNAYFLERFVPCTPRCERAVEEGRRISDELEKMDPDLAKTYKGLQEDHMKDVLNGVILDEKAERIRGRE